MKASCSIRTKSTRTKEPILFCFKVPELLFLRSEASNSRGGGEEIPVFTKMEEMNE